MPNSSSIFIFHMSSTGIFSRLLTIFLSAIAFIISGEFPFNAQNCFITYLLIFDSRFSVSSSTLHTISNHASSLIYFILSATVGSFLTCSASILVYHGFAHLNSHPNQSVTILRAKFEFQISSLSRRVLSHRPSTISSAEPNHSLRATFAAFAACIHFSHSHRLLTFPILPKALAYPTTGISKIATSVAICIVSATLLNMAFLNIESAVSLPTSHLIILSSHQNHCFPFIRLY